MVFLLFSCGNTVLLAALWGDMFMRILGQIQLSTLEPDFLLIIIMNLSLFLSMGHSLPYVTRIFDTYLTLDLSKFVLSIDLVGTIVFTLYS